MRPVEVAGSDIYTQRAERVHENYMGELRFILFVGKHLVVSFAEYSKRSSDPAERQALAVLVGQLADALKGYGTVVKLTSEQSKALKAFRAQATTLLAGDLSQIIEYDLYYLRCSEAAANQALTELAPGKVVPSVVRIVDDAVETYRPPSIPQAQLNPPSQDHDPRLN